jgi:hypothetical protein
MSKAKFQASLPINQWRDPDLNREHPRFSELQRVVAPARKIPVHRHLSKVGRPLLFAVDPCGVVRVKDMEARVPTRRARSPARESSSRTRACSAAAGYHCTASDLLRRSGAALTFDMAKLHAEGTARARTESARTCSRTLNWGTRTRRPHDDVVSVREGALVCSRCRPKDSSPAESERAANGRTAQGRLAGRPSPREAVPLAADPTNLRSLFIPGRVLVPAC